MSFQLRGNYQPAGDQPKAITALTQGLQGDPASARIGGPVSPLGVLHLARERRGPALATLFPDGPP